MSERGSEGALAIFMALIIAAVVLGSLLLRNWLAYKTVSDALGQPAYTFPAPQIQVTPFAIGTPWFNPSSWYYATPTVEQSGVIIINP